MNICKCNNELITDYPSIPETLYLSIDQSCMFSHSFLLGFSDGDKFCSCYTYVNDSYMEWPKAAKSCQFNDKHLVVMETVREWEYIKKEIQTRKSGKSDEWLIGLHRNLSTGKWTWVNGKPLTFDKWQNEKPQKGDFYALIAKEFPERFKGSFNSIKGNVYRGWICEEETGIITLLPSRLTPFPTPFNKAI